MKAEKRVKEVLHVIFVLHVQGVAPVMADAKALRHLVESVHEPFDMVKRSRLDYCGCWGWCLCDVSIELTDEFTEESSDLLQTSGTITRPLRSGGIHIDDGRGSCIGDPIDVVVVRAERIAQRSLDGKINRTSFVFGKRTLCGRIVQSCFHFPQANDGHMGFQGRRTNGW